MKTTGTHDHWEFYQDNNEKHHKWRWRRTASNGRIVGASTQGYSEGKDASKTLFATDISRLIGRL